MEKCITILVVVGVLLFLVLPIIFMVFCSSCTEIYKRGACFTDDCNSKNKNDL